MEGFLDESGMAGGTAQPCLEHTSAFLSSRAAAKQRKIIWIVTVCLGACIFRHVQLRVTTFTWYLTPRGPRSALYTLCCASGTPYGSDVNGGRRWNLTSVYSCVCPWQGSIPVVLTVLSELLRSHGPRGRSLIQGQTPCCLCSLERLCVIS